MPNKMLIDATHPEETRVVVLRGNRVEEFDFEAANRKQLRGNIYLAKVTRVEPSLQAAFVDYGGNRHGFLAFSEIHPDYYQIPVADRQALLEEERLRQSSDDDFEPADDDAGLQEIDDPVGDDFTDDEDIKAEAADSTDSDDEIEAEAAGSDDESGGDDDAEESEDAPSLAAEDASEAGPDSEEDGDPESGESDGESEDPAKRDVPDRFLAANRDDDAKITGDVPEATEPSENDAPTAEAASEAAETTAQTTDESPVAVSEDTETSPEQAPDVVDVADACEPEEAPETARTAPEDDSQDEPETEQPQPETDDPDVAAATETADEDTAEAKPAPSESEAARPRPRRRYKIQEVIKRRQIILVQVVKEERGTKGAALTTYLSLAGRYSVLMPNSARGGGISRKITSPGDRKRLKQIANELPVPDGMGVILRTAGASRTKTEIKRDFEYLMRLWENVRDLTLKSSAPTLVYEEGNLVKRSIRDLYNKDIDEVLVAGDSSYREAKDFMRMLMPSHAKNVQPYRDQVPVFAKYRVEPQLDAMFLPQVTLPSGGYVVINQTEALVAIDVNSGKATREHNIEDTALRTNLEAAEEISRQLRLRDLAGLIVIDFIDMEEKRNNRSVERKLKDCLKTDRARIQVGRISHFGLLEMSRQRLRTGVLESSTELCPHCHGTGIIRSTESVALYVLRTIEDQLLRNASHNLNVRIRTQTALYIINNKRPHLTDIEDRYAISINLVADETIEEANCLIERAGAAESRPNAFRNTQETVQPDTIEPVELAEEDEEEDGGRRKRRRKRRRRGRDGDGEERPEGQVEAGAVDEDADGENRTGDRENGDGDGDGDEESGGKRRRRGRRGGRRNKRGGGGMAAQEAGETDRFEANGDVSADDSETPPEEVAATAETTDPALTHDADVDKDEAPNADIPESDGSPRGEDGTDNPVEPASEADSEAVDATPDTDPEALETPDFEANGRHGPADIVNTDIEEASATDPEPEAPPPAPSEETPEENRPKRSGWWQRRGFFKPF